MLGIHLESWQNSEVVKRIGIEMLTFKSNLCDSFLGWELLIKSKLAFLLEFCGFGKDGCTQRQLSQGFYTFL